MPISNKLVKRRQKLLNALMKNGLFELLKTYATEHHYCHGMLYDFLVRDHQELIKGFNRKQLTHLLIKWGINHDNKKYLKLPQVIKLQFKFPKTMSFDEIVVVVHEQSARGAKKTQDLRRSWKHYIPKNEPDYWVKKGLSNEAAKIAAYEFRASKSPHSKYFTKYACLTDEEVSSRISEYAIVRGLAGLEAQRYCVSKIELRVHDALRQANIIFFTQKQVRTSKFEQSHCLAQKLYVYDIFVPEKNLLIECNGTYWHADSRVYLAEDVINYPSGTLTAFERWQKDKIKADVATNRGFKIMYAWELDIQSDERLISFVKEIKCLNS